MRSNNTLNKDIKLTEKEYGYWDYEFQYGDYVQAENKQSLRNGLIIACLTSWNYLNRQQNPTYQTFGNRAYEELKKKKSRMVEYTIKQYFLEVLNRIRRVHRVVDLEVLDHPTDPNAYNVKFTVEATNDEIVKGQFSITNEKGLSPTFIEITTESITSSPTKPAMFNVKINTEYEDILDNEIIYCYRIFDDESEEFIKAYKNNTTILIPPFNKFGYDKIKFKFQGNEQFQGCESEAVEMLSIPFFFNIDEDDNLQVIKSKDYNVTIWIGEIAENYESISYDGNPNKHYLIKTDEEDYAKYTYHENTGYIDSGNVYTIINQGTYGEITVGDMRLFVEDLNKDLYIIGRIIRTEDNHIRIML